MDIEEIPLEEVEEIDKIPHLEYQILMAIRNHDPQQVLHFLQQGANPNYWPDELSPFFTSNVEILQLLLSFGYDPNAYCYFGQTPLHTYAYSGNLECVRLLLEWGADRSLKDDNEQTATTIAGWSNFPEIVKLLQEK